jgi:hypothetical protein
MSKILIDLPNLHTGYLARSLDDFERLAIRNGGLETSLNELRFSTATWGTGNAIWSHGEMKCSFDFTDSSQKAHTLSQIDNLSSQGHRYIPEHDHHLRVVIGTDFESNVIDQYIKVFREFVFLTFMGLYIKDPLADSRFCLTEEQLQNRASSITHTGMLPDEDYTFARYLNAALSSGMKESTLFSPVTGDTLVTQRHIGNKKYGKVPYHLEGTTLGDIEKMWENWGNPIPRGNNPANFSLIRNLNDYSPMYFSGTNPDINYATYRLPFMPDEIGKSPLEHSLDEIAHRMTLMSHLFVDGQPQAVTQTESIFTAIDALSPHEIFIHSKSVFGIALPFARKLREFDSQLNIKILLTPGSFYDYPGQDLSELNEFPILRNTPRYRDVQKSQIVNQF